MKLFVLTVSALWKLLTGAFLAAVVLIALVFFADANTNYPIKWCAYQLVVEKYTPHKCTDIPRD